MLSKIKLRNKLKSINLELVDIDYIIGRINDDKTQIIVDFPDTKFNSRLAVVDKDIIIEALHIQRGRLLNEREKTIEDLGRPPRKLYKDAK